MTRVGAGGGLIDLHTHSRESDGTQTPRELVREAAESGLGVLALTDHDTVHGWDEAARAAREHGIALVPGIELSTRLRGHSVHLLGYLIDPDDTALATQLSRLRGARRRRAEEMVERLAEDYDITWSDVLARSPDDASVGRPHIADTLVDAGVVASRDEAFLTVLDPRHGYYVALDAPTPREGVRLVREAGGVPVLAHPATRGRSGSLTVDDLEELVEAGLAGLEVDHRENTDEGRVFLRDFARTRGLLTTGSSDYHGAGKPNRLGEHHTSAEMFEEILAQARGTRPVLG